MGTENVEVIITGTDKLSGVLDSISGKLKQTGDAAGGGGLGGVLSGLAGTVATVSAVAVGAFAAIGAAAIGAMKGGLDATLAWNEQIHELTKRFGMAGEDASGFAVAMNHVGLSVDEGAYGLNYFTRMLDNSNAVTKTGTAVTTPFGDALKKLGVSATDAHGKMKTFDQIMPEIMDKFAKLPEGVNASALSMDLFGARGGSKFLEFLRLGSTGISDYTKLAKEMGLSMSTTQVDATEQFSRALNDLGLGLKGIWNQLGLAIMPAFKELVDYINKNIFPVIVTWAKEHGPALTAALRDLGTTAGTVFGLIRDQKWGELADMFWSWVKKIAEEAGKKLGDMVALISKIISDHWDPDIKPALTGWANKFWDWLTVDVIPRVPKVFSELLDATNKWLTENWPKIQDTLREWSGKFWDWVTDPKDGVIVRAAQALEELLKAITAWIEKPETRKALSDDGSEVGRDIIEGITTLFEKSDDPVWKKAQNSLAIGLKNLILGLDRALLELGAGIASGIVEGITQKLTGSEMSTELSTKLENFIREAMARALTGFAPGLSDVLGWTTAPKIGSYQGGGTVPGYLGQPQLALVHGGETILQAGRSGGLTINFYYAPTVSLADEREAQDKLLPYIIAGVTRARRLQAI